MTRHFENELDRLKKKILHLAALVEEALQNAVRAAIDHDLALADNVISADADIDAHEIRVEEECLKILALHQPVAADLRYIVAVLKINSDLERIGDLAANIAKRGKDLLGQHESIVPFDLSAMLDATVKLVRMAVDSLVKEDTKLAAQVRLDDDHIDDFHRIAFQTIQKEIAAAPEQTSYLISVLSISRNLERIADHATNIAEDVIYMSDGEIIRHQEPTGTT